MISYYLYIMIYYYVFYSVIMDGALFYSNNNTIRIIAYSFLSLFFSLLSPKTFITITLLPILFLKRIALGFDY